MFDHNIKDIGLYTRPSTQGDELDLVEDFIEYYIHNFLKSNKTNNNTMLNTLVGIGITLESNSPNRQTPNTIPA